MYDFKRKIEDQSSDIAETQRKIASLSGSTNAADIAERRKLEATLYDQQRDLEDSYRDHSNDSVAKALDDEMDAFQEAKDEMIEILREGLEDTEEIFKKLVGEVALNADVINEEINDTAEKDGITLSDLLTGPWVAAGGAATTFKDGADITLKDMIDEDGVITLFNTTATSSLANPFINAATAETGPIAQFETAVTNAISNAQKKVNGEDGTQNYLGNSVGKPWEDAAAEDGPIATFSGKVDTAIEDAKKKVNGEEGTQNYLGDGLGKPWSDAAAEDGPIATFSGKVDDVIKNAQTKVNGEDGTQNYLGNGLTKPWEDATAEDGPINTFDDTVDSVINAVKKKVMGEDGTQNYLGNELAKPWETDAPNTFSSNVEIALNNTIGIVKQKVAEINAETAKVKMPTPPSYTGDSSNPTSNNSTNNSGGGGDKLNKEAVKKLQKFINANWNTYIGAGMGPFQLAVDGSYGAKTKQAVKNIQNGPLSPWLRRGSGNFDAATVSAMQKFYDSEMSRMKNYPVAVAEYQKRKAAIPAPLYAKGTLGTKRDEWAITDEIGDELVMYATPEGRLSYMRVGSTVVPHDLTKELINIGEVGLDGLKNMPQVNSGINLMSNYISKPEINLTFDALVKAERIDENTLPEVKKFVHQEINNLMKNMNYALKGKGGR